MGEYASITIGQYSICDFKNYLDNGIVSLFFSSCNLFVKESENNLEQKYDKCIYKSTVKQSKDRFDCLGYGLKNFEILFNSLNYDDFEYDYKLLERINYSEGELITIRNKHISFRKWFNSLSKYIKFDIHHGVSNSYQNNYYQSDLVTTFCDKLIANSLRSDDQSFYGIRLSVNDIVPFIYRAILELFDDNEFIELDFTDLQFWDEKSITLALSDSGKQEKTIVLVEGPNDKKILDFSLKQLYPHLSDLIYIMDFNSNGTKRGGGSSFVYNNFKTFYLSNIKIKIVALFDNDAQGFQSACMLNDEIRILPKNMKVLRYPDLKCFKKYPTISPNNKIVDDDINRRGASIELYLPDELITDNNFLLPIEWESRIEIKNGIQKFQMYQGVITKKKEIQDKIDDYIKRVETNTLNFDKTHWTKMDVLLTKLLFSFASFE